MDDFYVKVFKPSGPIISSFEGAANGFSVSLVDAEGNGLDLDSVEAKFDGADVTVKQVKERWRDNYCVFYRCSTCVKE